MFAANKDILNALLVLEIPRFIPMWNGICDTAHIVNTERARDRLWILVYVAFLELDPFCRLFAHLLACLFFTQYFCLIRENWRKQRTERVREHEEANTVKYSFDWFRFIDLRLYCRWCSYAMREILNANRKSKIFQSCAKYVFSKELACKLEFNKNWQTTQ